MQFDGPVIIPGLYNGTNKTFFMGAYEGLRSERTTSPIGSMPTERMRRGDFGEIATQITNPYTKVPYPGNQIPLSDISDEAVRLLQYYPLPNLPGLANNYQGPVLTESNIDQLLAASIRTSPTRRGSTSATTGSTPSTGSAASARRRASTSRA